MTHIARERTLLITTRQLADGRFVPTYRLCTASGETVMVFHEPRGDIGPSEVLAEMLWDTRNIFPWDEFDASGRTLFLWRDNAIVCTGTLEELCGHGNHPTNIEIQEPHWPRLANNILYTGE